MSSLVFTSHSRAPLPLFLHCHSECISIAPVCIYISSVCHFSLSFLYAKEYFKKHLKMQQLLDKQLYKRPLYAGLYSLDLSVSLYSHDRT